MRPLPKQRRKTLRQLLRTLRPCRRIQWPCRAGPAQVEAMTFPLGKKVQMEVNGSRRWFAFTTGSGTDYEVWLAPGGQYYRTIGFAIYNRLGELVWESGTNDDGSITVRQVQLSAQTPYFVSVAQDPGHKGTVTFRMSPLSETGSASSGISSEGQAVSAAQSQSTGILDLEGGSAQGGAVAFQLEQMVRAKNQRFPQVVCLYHRQRH